MLVTAQCNESTYTSSNRGCETHSHLSQEPRKCHSSTHYWDNFQAYSSAWTWASWIIEFSLGQYGISLEPMETPIASRPRVWRWEELLDLRRLTHFFWGMIMEFSASRARACSCAFTIYCNRVLEACPYPLSINLGFPLVSWSECIRGPVKHFLIPIH